jgi:hypothetical protein
MDGRTRTLPYIHVGGWFIEEQRQERQTASAGTTSYHNAEIVGPLPLLLQSLERLETTVIRLVLSLFLS